MSVITEYTRSTERQEAMAELELELFDINDLKHEDRWFRNKPTKNKRAHQARIKAKQRGFSY